MNKTNENVRDFLLLGLVGLFYLTIVAIPVSNKTCANIFAEPTIFCYR